MPAELGGGGLSHLDRILCEEQFGHTSDYLIRRAFGNVYEPLLCCKDGQIDRSLRPAVTGERTCAIAITEPGAGSDAAGIRTRATKTATDFMVRATTGGLPLRKGDGLTNGTFGYKKIILRFQRLRPCFDIA